MAKRKTPPTTPGEQIAQQILDNYDIKSAEDVQDVLKQIFAPIFESMLKGEMENHLGHKNHERSEDGGNVRNGYSSKRLKTSLGEVPIRVPRDRQKFKTDWQAYPGAVSVWANNFSHVEQLYNYGSAVRKIMYTTNAIESVNSSFRKVTKKGAFPHEDAVFKIFYLRILELYKKWEGCHVANWAMVQNQLLMDDRMSQLMQQYDVAY